MKPTQEQVIAWYEQANGWSPEGWDKTVEELERFATLAYDAGQESMKWDGIHSCHPDCQRPACVHTRKAVEAEREACAKVCEEYQDAVDRHRWPNGYECAAAIRARREQ